MVASSTTTCRQSMVGIEKALGRSQPQIVACHACLPPPFHHRSVQLYAPTQIGFVAILVCPRKAGPEFGRGLSAVRFGGAYAGVDRKIHPMSPNHSDKH